MSSNLFQTHEDRKTHNLTPCILLLLFSMVSIGILSLRPLAPLFKKYFGTRRRRAALLLIILAVAIPLTLTATVKTVKGAVVDTKLLFAGPLSIDSGRIAAARPGTPVTQMGLYDVSSGTSTTFALPANTNNTGIVTISGDKIVTTATHNVLFGPYTVYYCVLPHAVPLQPCGSWVSILSQPRPFAAAFGGDIIAWEQFNDVSYYRFSSKSITNITVAGPTTSTPSTNGVIVAFGAKASLASPSATVMYYDTTAVSPAVVDTGLPTGPFNSTVNNAGGGFGMSISQDTIVFSDNTTAPACYFGTVNQICESHLRYYDIYRNQASPAGTGPLGVIPAFAQMISGNRIVFATTESSLNFDCNGNGSFFTNSSLLGGTTPDMCLTYWNIRGPSYVVPFLDPSAAPAFSPLGTGLGLAVAISGNIIAFTRTTLLFATVPMKGDINGDGMINIQDLTLVAICFGQNFKGSVC